MSQKQILYSGKIKTLYLTDNPKELVVFYSDRATAFNAEKEEYFENKGALNNAINAFFMQQLQQKGIVTDFIKKLSSQESLVQRLTMIPIECVVRNRVAGSLVKRLGLPKGKVLAKPIFEFFLKNDALGDPMINPWHVEALDLVPQKILMEMTQRSLQINDILQTLFHEVDLALVDFKIEFGLDEQNQLVLGDEITPDGCRIWAPDGEILDKDRFRQSLGGLVAAYQTVADKFSVVS